MMGEKTHIALIHDERVPNELLDKFCTDVKSESLDFKRVERPEQGPQSGLEWLAISAIALFIMKSYFDGFLKEAGKDHYVVLRTTLKGLWNHFFKKDRNFRVAVLTAKGEMKQEYSLLFSIYAEIDNKKKVKFLIREGCSEENYAKGIDAFLDLIESYHMHDSSKEVDIDLDGEKDNWGQILIEFDTEMKCLRVLDPISRAKNRNKM